LRGQVSASPAKKDLRSGGVGRGGRTREERGERGFPVIFSERTQTAKDGPTGGTVEDRSSFAIQLTVAAGKKENTDEGESSTQEKGEKGGSSSSDNAAKVEVKKKTIAKKARVMKSETNRERTPPSMLRDREKKRMKRLKGRERGRQTLRQGDPPQGKKVRLGQADGLTFLKVGKGGKRPIRTEN